MLRSASFARALALVAALLSSAVWIWLVWLSPYAPGGEGGPPSWIASVLFPGLAWAGAIAAFRDAPVVLGVVGVISLVPVGTFFLLAPGVLRLIGVAPLLMIAAAILLLRGLREGPPRA
jgi:hypothetical protein